MFITYTELFALSSFRQAQLAAGKGGLKKPIRWYHLIEIKDMSQWIEAGTLVFITGVGLKNIQQNLCDILDILGRKKASGLVINVGVYISELSEEVLQKADLLNIPLITIPESVKLIRVTYELGHCLLQAQTKEQKRRQKIHDLLMLSNSDPAPDVSGLNLSPDSMYCVGILKITDRQGNNVTLNNAAIYEAQSYIQNTASRSAFYDTVYDQNIFILPIAPDSSAADIQNLYSVFASKIHTEKEERIQIGVSRPCASPSVWHNAYLEAQKALFVNGSAFFNTPVTLYQNLGLLQAVDFSKKDALQQMISETLGPVQTQPVLLQTLTEYFLCGRNEKQASQMLHTHVNTTKYRLKKILTLLPVPFTTEQDKILVESAVILQSVLSVM
ncbi:MAG: PucR family transcriptional regulator ligand-binding domain-containing protein [Lachnospiraceae bacterium]|nr:PucR family transcriptional regulator ligand-binding domain-containing protein [Lachnospiraceae bacterium]